MHELIRVLQETQRKAMTFAHTRENVNCPPPSKSKRGCIAYCQLLYRYWKLVERKFHYFKYNTISKAKLLMYAEEDQSCADVVIILDEDSITAFMHIYSRCSRAFDRQHQLQ